MGKETVWAEPFVVFPWLEKIIIPFTSHAYVLSGIPGVEEKKAAFALKEGFLVRSVGEFADGAGGWIVRIVRRCKEGLGDEFLAMNTKGDGMEVRSR
jgi:hypothetical protein